MSEAFKYGIHIVNLDAFHDLRIRIEILASKPLRSRFRFVKVMLSGEGFIYLIKEDEVLPARGTIYKVFPFEPCSEEVILEVVVYVRVSMSEFGFPLFFGEADLRPIRRKFIIRP